MRAVNVFIAAALLLVTGCARPTYTFEGNWSGDEQDQVMAGFEEWVSRGVDLPSVTIKRMDGPCVSDADLGPHSAEFGYGSTDGTIELYPDCMQTTAPKGDLAQTSAHEMGHVLGLGHYEGDEPSVMKANSGDDAPTVTALDLEHVRSLQ